MAKVKTVGSVKPGPLPSEQNETPQSQQAQASPEPSDADSIKITPEMIAAGWAVVNDGRKWPPRIGPGPGLVEVYKAMRALEPK